MYIPAFVRFGLRAHACTFVLSWFLFRLKDEAHLLIANWLLIFAFHLHWRHVMCACLFTDSSSNSLDYSFHFLYSSDSSYHLLWRSKSGPLRHFGPRFFFYSSYPFRLLWCLHPSSLPGRTCLVLIIGFPSTFWSRSFKWFRTKPRRNHDVPNQKTITTYVDAHSSDSLLAVVIYILRRNVA